MGARRVSMISDPRLTGGGYILGPDVMKSSESETASNVAGLHLHPQTKMDSPQPRELSPKQDKPGYAGHRVEATSEADSSSGTAPRRACLLRTGSRNYCKEDMP